MVYRSKGGKVRTFLSRLFTSQRAPLEGEPRLTPDGVDSHAGPMGGVFANAHNFVVHGLAVNYNVQGEKERITQAMRLLAHYVIPGAAHDSSVRDPPPQCHPGTRIKLNERITTWFYGRKRQKAILWVNGPAGVGKSAVIQTFAESLATSNHLGASVFFSRPNKRNDPQRVFITIAYQLAVRIEAYRAFIAEQLALDPDLLNKGMKEQFRMLIVGPFVTKKIELGGDTWGVLLDGLDEVEGHGPQRDIIRLISNFVLEHPEAPLVWIIASRPEPHISDTFGEEEVVPSYWQEYIPVDSTEACEDVERFLRASFETIRKEFPRSAPKEWPNEGAFLKLAGGASGLFVFAAVAIRFIGDANFASPVSRLELVLSAIEGSKVVTPEDQPFAHLDALYTQILTSIRPASWLIAKRLFGFVLYSRSNGSRGSFRLRSRSLKGMSVILDLEQDIIYASLNKCYSILEISSPKDAYSKSVTFFHASLADYLTDSTRSKDCYICPNDADDDMVHSLFRLMQDFVVKESPRSMFMKILLGTTDTLSGSDVLVAWIRHCEQHHSRAPRQKSGKIQAILNRDLFNDSCEASYHMVTRSLESEGGRRCSKLQQDRFECLDILGQVDIADLSLNFEIVLWLFNNWEEYSDELVDRGLVREIPLKELKFRHLDGKRLWPRSWGPHVNKPWSSAKLSAFTSEVESLQRQMPELKVLIFGSKPEIRNALLRYGDDGRTCYFIPYPY